MLQLLLLLPVLLLPVLLLLQTTQPAPLQQL
jgi:hypothetical protein